MQPTHLPSTLLLLGLCLLPACSSYAPPDALAGMTREAVVAHMGKPASERRIGTDTRLEFPTGPYGKHTWFIDFDAAGRASRAEQVLTETNFQRISVGMAQDDVRQLLGRPSEVYTLGRGRGVVWNYRYENYVCLWFQVELSIDKLVRSAGNGPLPECNPRHHDR